MSASKSYSRSLSHQAANKAQDKEKVIDASYELYDDEEGEESEESEGEISKKIKHK